MRAWTPIPIGTILKARFEVTSQLRVGGFGATYLVRDRHRFDDELVLKELLPAELEHREIVERLFLREAQTLQRLSHASIPALHAYFEDSGRYYLVQARVVGETLEDVLAASGALPEARVKQIVVDLLGVLAYLHRQAPAIIHRDIKPSNVMVDHLDRTFLIDFGAVKEAVGHTQVERDRTRISTSGYAPPEQELHGHVVPASDLYALGATAIEMLTGEPPWHRHDPVAGRFNLHDLPISSGFSDTLARMVEPGLDRRAASAGVVLEMLEAGSGLNQGRAAETVLESDPARTIVEQSGTETTVEPPASGDPFLRAALPIRRLLKGRPKWLVPALVVLAALAAANWRTSPREPAVPPGPAGQTTKGGSGGAAPPTSTTTPATTSTNPDPPIPRVVLGMRVQTDSELAVRPGREDVPGALVLGIDAGSPALRAGLRTGDIILSIDGEPVTDGPTLITRLASSVPGAAVALAVVRAGRDRNVVAILEAPGKTRVVVTDDQPEDDRKPGKSPTQSGRSEPATRRPSTRRLPPEPPPDLPPWRPLPPRPRALPPPPRTLPPPRPRSYTYCATPVGNFPMTDNTPPGRSCHAQTARGLVYGVVRFSTR